MRITSVFNHLIFPPSLHLDTLLKVNSFPLKLQLTPVLAVGARASRPTKDLFCGVSEIFENGEQVPCGLRVFFKQLHFSSLPSSSVHALHCRGSQHTSSDLCDLCRVHAALPCPVHIPTHRTLQNAQGFLFL